MNRTKMIHQLDRSLPDSMIRLFPLRVDGEDDTFPTIQKWLDDYRRQAKRKYGTALMDIWVDMERFVFSDQMKVCVQVRLEVL